jgi:hypothetical protein
VVKHVAWCKLHQVLLDARRTVYSMLSTAAVNSIDLVQLFPPCKTELGTYATRPDAEPQCCT